MASDQLEGAPSLQAPARQVSLLRLLLLAISLGVMSIAFDSQSGVSVDPALSDLGRLLLSVGVMAALLAFTVGWVRRQWHLALQLVFDLLWTGMLLYLTGGIASPGVVILFAIILIGTLILPGVAPFVLPSLASLILAASAIAYLVQWTPFSDEYLALNPALIDANRIIGVLATQIAALFLVDLLGQSLARRLHEQRLLTGELLDQLGEGVLAVDRQAAVLYVNAEAVRLLGLDQHGVQGRRVAEVLSGPELKPIADLVRDGECPTLQRFVAPGPRQLVLRLTRLVDGRGRDIGRTLLIADETRLQLLEEGARRAQHLVALGEMAAGIAHEVRNPLTSLRGCAQELADINRKEGNADAADLARIMVGEADRLARIVEDFLALSRMRPPQREELDFAPMFAELERMYGLRSDLPPQLRLAFAIDPACKPVSADPGQMRQVLINLIDNAIDALRRTDQPRLRISAAPVDDDNPLSGESVVLMVADNGSGILPEVQARIFTPFFSTKSQGTGLGLSMVQRIVREHEGVLSLDSAPGRGTTVRIYLPTHSQTRMYLRALGGG